MAWSAVGGQGALGGDEDRFQVDDLQPVYEPEEVEQPLDLRGVADEDQPPAAAPSPDVCLDDHAKPGAVHERELAQIDDHQDRAAQRLIDVFLELRGAGDVQLATEAEPRRVPSAATKLAAEVLCYGA
jgi:hypothetical protein